MPNHHTWAKLAPLLPDIRAYLSDIPPDQGITNKALGEHFYPDNETERRWLRGIAPQIAEALPEYCTRGKPYMNYGQTMRAYFWHGPRDPNPVTPKETWNGLEKIWASLEALHEKLDRLLGDPDAPA